MLPLGEFRMSSMGNACPQPKLTMAWGGLWAWDSNELIQNKWAWASARGINAKKAAANITVNFFNSALLYASNADMLIW